MGALEGDRSSGDASLRSRPHPGDAYFASLGDRMGEAYLRYAFTKGTPQEAEFVLDVLDLPSGARILDVGCGAGRHAVAFARRGFEVTGIDVSRGLLDVAARRAGAAGVRLALFEVDAREMPFDDEFDAVVSICQGGFGLMGDQDGLVLRRMAEASLAGGRVILTAFSAYYELTHLRADAVLDPSAGVVYERTTIRDEAGAEHHAELWTSVFTPRELRLLALGVGLVPEDVWSVDPGAFAPRPPDMDHAELMLVARKP